MSNEKKLKALAEERGFALKQFAALNDGGDDTKYQCSYDSALEAVTNGEIQEEDGSVWVAEYRLVNVKRFKVVKTPDTVVEV